MSIPDNVPFPVIFGSKLPKLRLKTIDGEQKFFSRTNHNLFLESDDYTEDGTFTMGQFLQKLECCGLFHDCSKNHYCPLFVESAKPDPLGAAMIRVVRPRTIGWLLKGEKSAKGPDWQICPAIQSLLNEMGADAENRFFLTYLDMNYCWCWNKGFQKIEKTWNDLQSREFFKQDYEERLYLVSAILVESFKAPALIPQVWLNDLPLWETSESEKRHLEAHPSRVDFFAISSGNRVIIEIDDPSHYAEFNKATRSYVVSEKRYTKNLKIERSFRKEGFELYRFSNLEILKEEPSNLILGLNMNIPQIEIDDGYIKDTGLLF